MLESDASELAKLSNALRDADFRVRLRAVRELGRFTASEAPALLTLIEACRDEALLVRLEAVRLVRQVIALRGAGPEAVRLVADMLGDLRPEVREAASEVLASVGREGASVLAAVVNGLDDPSRRVRVNCFLTLENLGPEAADAVPKLISFLADPEADDGCSCRYAMEALGSIGIAARAAIPALLEHVRHGKEIHAEVAAIALSFVAPENTETIPVLIKGLGTFFPRHRLEIVESLGRLGPRAKEAIPHLRAYLEDDAWKARRAHEEPECDISDTVREAILQIGGSHGEPGESA